MLLLLFLIFFHAFSLKLDYFKNKLLQMQCCAYSLIFCHSTRRKIKQRKYSFYKVQQWGRKEVIAHTTFSIFNLNLFYVDLSDYHIINTPHNTIVLTYLVVQYISFASIFIYLFSLFFFRCFLLNKIKNNSASDKKHEKGNINIFIVERKSHKTK